MTVFVGDILNATAAPVSAAPASSRAWQWFRSGTAVPAATNSSYRITEADIDSALSVRQGESNFMGSAFASSDQTAAVGAWSPAALFTLNEPGIWLDPSDVANLDWRRNLLTWTEQFDNAVWQKQGTTSVTANTAVAPDGTTTVDRVVIATGNNQGLRQDVALAAGTYRFSVWARAIGSATTLRLASFALGTNIFTTALPTGSLVRYEATFTYAVGGTAQLRIDTNDLGGTIDLWGAQLELGSTATDYQKITDVNTEVIERFPNATLYQDTAGTTPVTTPGQPVGLALDKSKGLVLGPELVTNGDFSGGATGWTLGTGWSVSGGSAVSVGGANAALSQTGGSYVSGRTYRVTFDITVTSGYVLAYVANGGNVQISTSGAKSLVLVASTSGGFTLFGFSFVGSVDNISVKELPGFHAAQSTSASRPTYGIVPKTGRRNLLTFTEQFDNAAWAKTAVTVAANSSAAPDGTLTSDTLIPTAVSTFHDIRSGANSSLPASACVLTAYVKAAGYNFVEIGISSNDTFTAYSTAVINLTNGTNAGTGVDLTWTTNSVSVQNVGSGWYRVSLAFTPNLATTTAMVFSAALPTSSRGVSFAGDGTSGILIWGAQLETGSTATAYQRVTTQFDVTEAGTPSLSYLFFGGDTDPRWLLTPTITPGTDKAQVFAGVRKLSDAAVGIVVEHSANVGANNGSFYLASGPNPTAGWSSSSRGTTSPGALQTAEIAIAAPDTAVLSSAHDIANDLTTLRRNGVAGTSATGDKGTGNFLAYPLYIGRRAGSSLAFNGQVFSLTVRFGTNLSTSDVNRAEYFVSQKTGVTL